MPIIHNEVAIRLKKQQKLALAMVTLPGVSSTMFHYRDTCSLKPGVEDILRYVADFL